MSAGASPSSGLLCPGTWSLWRKKIPHDYTVVNKESCIWGLWCKMAPVFRQQSRSFYKLCTSNRRCSFRAQHRSDAPQLSFTPAPQQLYRGRKSTQSCKTAPLPHKPKPHHGVTINTVQVPAYNASLHLNTRTHQVTLLFTKLRTSSFVSHHSQLSLVRPYQFLHINSGFSTRGRRVDRSRTQTGSRRLAVHHRQVKARVELTHRIRSVTVPVPLVKRSTHSLGPSLGVCAIHKGQRTLHI